MRIIEGEEIIDNSERVKKASESVIIELKKKDNKEFKEMLEARKNRDVYKSTKQLYDFEEEGDN